MAERIHRKVVGAVFFGVVAMVVVVTSPQLLDVVWCSAVVVVVAEQWDCTCNVYNVISAVAVVVMVWRN